MRIERAHCESVPRILLANHPLVTENPCEVSEAPNRCRSLLGGGTSAPTRQAVIKGKAWHSIHLRAIPGQSLLTARGARRATGIRGNHEFATTLRSLSSKTAMGFHVRDRAPQVGGSDRRERLRRVRSSLVRSTILEFLALPLLCCPSPGV